ncbi:MAG: type II toxin-antitoxin system Phd/YefM family antitoxin [Clostridia bacterium]|nr:type II toxin-antitoxin system Phd/YefM family antitoxin [Clostridia bacterium]MBR6889826.1 type II toxin-antitoxin system Phd/YefM family antitoxin [Clostridia bacterium]
MIIKPSSALRNNYSGISSIAKKTQEPVYITVNGEGDGVFMDMEAFEKREQLLNLRARILQAEEDRLRGARTMSVSEAREALRKL